MKFIKKLLSYSAVEKKYVRAGATFGDAVSFLYMGECIGFKNLLNKWAVWEEEYARRGFRTVSIDRFVQLEGYGKSIANVIGQKREKGENPVFHAKIYREQFLGKVAPTVDLEKMMTDNKPQFGQYTLPSTEQGTQEN